MQDKRYWAHTTKGKQAETLGEHSLLCLIYYGQYCCKKGVGNIVRCMIRECGCDEAETAAIYRIFVDAIYWHDIGKINGAYQRNVLHNKAFPATTNSKNHAHLSAYIYLREHMQHLQNFSDRQKRKLIFFIYSFSYTIARHHGYLKDIKAANFTEKIQSCMEAEEFYPRENYLKKSGIYTSEDGYDKLKKIISNEVAFYILNKLLFSVITSCDYCATAEYMSGARMEFSVIEDVDRLLKSYQNGEIYQSVEKYHQDKNIFSNTINELRCQMFFESYDELLKHPHASLYYLEAPTGSGKTNTSINLGLTLLKENAEINNLFYIFPFNTLVEQTAEVLERYFKVGEELAVVNSLTPIYMYDKKNDEDDFSQEDYEVASINRSFMNYPIVITSHVNLFSALFGTGREQIFPLIQLCNSVVILDEIQSYRNGIWHEMILFLLQYAELLNIKIIIMSATLPKLDGLLGQHAHEIVELIKNPQAYYQNPFFKDRVKLDFSLLAEGKIDLAVLRDKVLAYKDKKVLVEFISKKTAREFYNMVVYDEEIYCVELTGDDNVYRRKKVLEEIKSCKKILVIATQVIEAGVDIDMDIGFKDVSIPDAEEQFLGRINRSCLRSGCIAYFFHYDDARAIYRDDKRVEYSISKPEIAELLANKDFAAIYEYVLDDIRTSKKSKNTEHIYYAYQECLELEYKKLEKRLQLIEKNQQIFLAYILQVGDKSIDGCEVWQRYRELCTNIKLGYGEKRVKLSEIAKEMSYFTYSVYNLHERTLVCDEEFGGYYYFERGEQFIEDGKFNRKAFADYMGGLFL